MSANSDAEVASHQPGDASRAASATPGRAPSPLKIVASVTRISVSAWGVIVLTAAVLDMVAWGFVKPLWLPIVLWAASPLLWTARARRRERAGAAGEHPKTAEVALAGLLLLPAALGTTVLLLLAAMSHGQALDWEAFYPFLRPDTSGAVYPPDFGMVEKAVLGFFIATRPMLAAAVLSFLIATPLNLVGLAWALGLRRPRWGALALLGLAPVFVYLARDDAKSPYPDVWKEYPAMTPSGKAGYDVVMRWPEGGEFERTFQSPPVLDRLPGSPGSEQWLKAIAEHQAQFDAAWTRMEPVRAWWAEWAVMPEIGDRFPRGDSPVFSWRIMHAYARMVRVQAASLARAGRGDEALELVSLLIEGAQKLQPAGRTRTRIASARVLFGIGVDAANHVLSLAQVSDAAKERLAAVLAKGSGGEAGARRVVGMELTFAAGFLSRDGDAEPITGGLLGSWLGPVLINPNRTLNRLGVFMAELQERAARRDADGMRTALEREKSATLAGRGIKNVFGDHLFMGAVPGSAQLVDLYWRAEDARAALIARLRGEQAPAPGATLPSPNQEGKK